MHDKLMKLMLNKKKEGKQLSDGEQKAKMDALMGMKDMASDMMSSRLKGLKKVTVASDSSEGLETGLETAKKAVGLEDEEEEPSADKGMSPQDAEMQGSKSYDVDQVLEEVGCKTPEDIDKLITELQAKKDELSQS